MIRATSANQAPRWPAGWSDPNSRHLHSLPPAVVSVELALDRIKADEVEREVARLVGQVDGPHAALRVVRGFRAPGGETSPQLKLW